MTSFNKIGNGWMYIEILLSDFMLGVLYNVFLQHQIVLLTFLEDIMIVDLNICSKWIINFSQLYNENRENINASALVVMIKSQTLNVAVTYMSRNCTKYLISETHKKYYFNPVLISAPWDIFGNIIHTRVIISS